ncbi:MAG: DUF3572 family protein [Paracoccus sp. (in: a-proteobacteria)]|nr:DUF3572 family protein [Paracoccus sp. (in: a-proteobacteria)]
MMNPSRAREIADELLLHILSDAELLESLLGRAGIAPEQLAGIVNGGQAHEFILDFVTESDDRVIACAGATGIAASDIGIAARRLAQRD